MISFPNAKINLGLHVLGKRKDGYHEIETCLYPIPLSDILEIIPSESFSFDSTGLTIPGSIADNLIFKAYQLLNSKFNLPPVAIHLHKVIPMGAGLGGGSSNGANALKMLNELFDLGLSNDSLEEFAGELGSDCPFFIMNVPVIATGTGTHLHPIDLDLSAYHVELLHPKAHVSTKEAYGMISVQPKETSLEDIVKLDPSNWNNKLSNDFECPMANKYPQIQDAINHLQKKGAIYTSMTGSGSSVFGIFEKTD